MEKEYLSSYISGLTSLASSLSKNIGPSFVVTRYYKKNELKIKKSNKTLKDYLKAWFQDSKIEESLYYWITLKVGEPIQVYTVEEDSFPKDEIPFYFLEDLFFVEFKDLTVCFLLGNNE